MDTPLAKKDRDNEEKRKEAWESWAATGIGFHSWRHFYAAHMADRVDMRSLQLATGHKSPTMAAHYAAHVETAAAQPLTEPSWALGGPPASAFPCSIAP